LVLAGDPDPHRTANRLNSLFERRKLDVEVIRKAEKSLHIRRDTWIDLDWKGWIWKRSGQPDASGGASG